MLESLDSRQKKAMARIGLGIMGISYGGKIRTNEPDIFGLFVDLFHVYSQEDLFPILHDIIKIDQNEAIYIARQLSNQEKDEFRSYMVDHANGDSRRLLAVAMLMHNIGFNSSYFKE